MFVEVNGERRLMTRNERYGVTPLPKNARPYRQDNLTSTGFSAQLSKAFNFGDVEYPLTGNIHWKTTASGLQRLAYAGRVERRGVSLSYVRFLDDFPVMPLVNVWLDTSWGFGEDKTYVVQTAPRWFNAAS